MKSRGERLEMEGPYNVTISQKIEDREWDEFVEFEARGHFEQSSIWAQVKGEAGWEPLRILIRQNGEMVAGVQILVRGLPWFGKAGYIPKGPLILRDDTILLPLVINLIKESSKTHRIRFFIAQAPHDRYDVDKFLLKEGFIRDHIFKVISATTHIDLTQSSDMLLSKMTKNYRYNIRFAERNGVMIRE